MGGRHFIKKSGKTRKELTTLTKILTLKLLILLPLLGSHRFITIKSFDGMISGIILNDIPVTFSPGTKLKHSRKFRPLDEF